MTDLPLDNNLPHIAFFIEHSLTDAAVARQLALRIDARIIHVEGVFYDWTGTHWRRLPDYVIPAFVQRLDGLRTPLSRCALALTSRRVSSITKLLAQRLERPAFFAAPAHGINAEDGFIVFDDIGNATRVAHDPEHRQRHVVPAAWDETAQGVLWPRLMDAFAGHPDATERLALVEEIIGVALSGMVELADRRLVVLHGQRPSGKTQMLDLIRSLACPAWRSAVGTFEMDEPSRAAQLVGARVNVSDEFGDQPFSRELVRLLTDGHVRVSRHGELARVEMMHVITSTRPPFSPPADVLARRVLVIEMNRPVVPPRIPNLGRRIAAEEPGVVLAHAVRGLSRLIANGGFTVPSSSVAATERWLRRGDPVAAFLASGVVRLDPAGRVGSREVHERYVVWARETGDPQLSLPALVRGLEAAGVRRISTGKRRLLTGLTIA